MEEGMVEVVNEPLAMDVFERRFDFVTMWNDKKCVNPRDLTDDSVAIYIDKITSADRFDRGPNNMTISLDHEVSNLLGRIDMKQQTCTMRANRSRSPGTAHMQEGIQPLEGLEHEKSFSMHFLSANEE
jgi:hypothetical protein